MSMYNKYRVLNSYLKAQQLSVRRLTLNNVKRNYEEECVLSDGQVLKIASGKFARSADGCATVTYKNTTTIATAVSKPITAVQSFTPLTVLYQNKASAIGIIPSNFLKKELGLSELEILTSRLIDRSIRSSFKEGFNWETQIICNPLALDGSVLPDVLSINAASAALEVSDIPWDGPVGAIRVGLKNDDVLINPSKKDLVDSKLNLIVTARCNKLVVMLEGSAENILINDLMKAISCGVKECEKVVKAIENLRIKCGKTKRNFVPKEYNEIFKSEIELLSEEELTKIFKNDSYDKLSRDNAIKKVYETVMSELNQQYDTQTLSTGSEIFYKFFKKKFKHLTLNSNFRCDGRLPDELRPIQCEVNLFPSLHGSALFQKGQTQVMATVALDSPNSAMKMDQITMLTSGLKEKNFFVHYYFPPYATKEVSRVTVGRREIGHGSLAEKALKANIPKNYSFTIRLTSEVLESNGSSSMATVCAGSMALLDAGIPVDKPSAGVAIGIVTKYDENDPEKLENYKILTDILGIEDFYGDMDFKIAGTNKSITALQLDMKIKGLPVKVVGEALASGISAIKKTLKATNSVISVPREGNNARLPVINQISVAPNIRGKFLGHGGFNLKKMEIDSGVEITEESPGCFKIFAPNEKAMSEVMEAVNNLLKSIQEPILEFGGVYTALIREIRDYGVMVTLYENMTPALIPISQLDQRKVSHPSALGLNVGNEINVKYFGRDPVSGVMRLSRKVLLGVSSEVQQSLHKSETSEESGKEKEDDK